MTKAELDKMYRQLKTLRPAERIPSWTLDAIFDHIKSLELELELSKKAIEECGATCQNTLVNNKSGAV